MSLAVRTPAILTDDQFEDMARKGAFDRVGRVELRGGVITPISPVHLGHSSALTALLIAANLAAEPKGLRANAELSIRFGRGFQPTADIVVWDPAILPANHDGPMLGAAVKLVIEVADASLPDDLGQKLIDYAQAGLGEYWVADVRARLIHRCHGPQEDGYRIREASRFGEACAAATFDLAIDTTRL